VDRIVCSWCQYQDDASRTTCSTCGAPLDVANTVSRAGWRAAPRLREMTEFRIGETSSTCQVSGEVVPVAEFALAENDAVFFEQHLVLWKERLVSLHGVSLMNKRRVAGMPYGVVEAKGPGRVALTRDASGELVVLPLHHGMELDVRGHSFIAASMNVSYDFIRIKGLANVMHGGNGMYIDRFVARNAPGLLILHGNGNVFDRRLAQGESIQVEPGGFLYKEPSVTMNTIKVPLGGGGFGHRNAFMAELAGPGRVGIQSMYVHHHTD
jgi:uncharacterized protein (AIM24 family)